MSPGSEAVMAGAPDAVAVDTRRRRRLAGRMALAIVLGIAAGLATGSAGFSPSAFWTDLAGGDAGLILGQIRAPRTLGAALAEWDVTFHEAEAEVLTPLVQGDGLLQLMQKNLPPERAEALLERLRHRPVPTPASSEPKD